MSTENQKVDDPIDNKSVLEYKGTSYFDSMTVGGSILTLKSDLGCNGSCCDLKNLIDLRECDLKKLQENYINATSKEEKEKIFYGTNTWQDSIMKVANDVATLKDKYKYCTKKLAELKKEKAEFLKKTGRDFSFEEAETYIRLFRTSESTVTVLNKWECLEGRIGRVNAVVKVGKREKQRVIPFCYYNTPDWRPLALVQYTTSSWIPNKSVDIERAINSWKDLRESLNNTEDQVIYIYKHPKK